MVGFTSAMKRSEAVPTAIEAGCDMFLFNKSLEEDFAYMLEGLGSGLLSQGRLEEAVTRILALKASLGLWDTPREKIVPPPEAMSIIGCAQHHRWARACADEAITLVKDRQCMLPPRPAKDAAHPPGGARPRRRLRPCQPVHAGKAYPRGASR